MWNELSAQTAFSQTDLFKETIYVFQDLDFKSSHKKIQVMLLHCLTFKLATSMLLVMVPNVALLHIEINY